MIPGTILTSTIAFVRGNWKAIVAALLLAPSIYLLGQCSGIKTGRAQMQHAIDVANVKALEAQHRADTLASNQRLADTLTVNHQTEALRDAIATTPDTAPDAIRIALSCARLRASGQDTAHIAACGRPGGGVQAGAAR
jgi:hypothetical protein